MSNVARLLSFEAIVTINSEIPKVHSISDVISLMVVPDNTSAHGERWRAEKGVKYDFDNGFFAGLNQGFEFVDHLEVLFDKSEDEPLPFGQEALGRFLIKPDEVSDSTRIHQ